MKLVRETGMGLHTDDCSENENSLRQACMVWLMGLTHELSDCDIIKLVGRRDKRKCLWLFM